MNMTIDSMLRANNRKPIVIFKLNRFDPFELIPNIANFSRISLNISIFYCFEVQETLEIAETIQSSIQTPTDSKPWSVDMYDCWAQINKKIWATYVYFENHEKEFKKDMDI